MKQMQENLSWTHIRELSMTVASNHARSSTGRFGIRFKGHRNPLLEATVTHLLQSAYLLLYTEPNKTSGILRFVTLRKKYSFLCKAGAGNIVRSSGSW